MKPPNAPATPRSLVSSSPARPEKLPGPSLARLLSRKLASRRRSRSGGAMFAASRSSRDGAAKAEEGEPSSPKVTCIGQVRIKKSKKEKKPKSKAKKPVMRCHCLRNSLLCGAFRVRKSKCRPWRRWGWGFSFGSGGKQSCVQRKSAEKKAEVAIKEIESDRQEIRDQKDEGSRTLTPSETATTTTIPPRNALMLMRSRSAPHNREALCLATRIPVSISISAASKESEEVVEEEEVGRSSKDRGEREEEQEQEEEEDEEEEMRCSSSRALVLTRCKSEPAGSGVKLVVPEVTVGTVSGGVDPTSLNSTSVPSLSFFLFFLS